MHGSDHAPPAVHETHISFVFLLGDRAYKLKKSVRFDFIDLTGREARERLCHREVELNRRLAPDVYLGVLDIVDADGRPVDHLVEMRRMPDDRRLSKLVTEHADVNACVRQLAYDLAAFHAAAPTSPEISEAATARAVRRNWDENLDEMSGFAGDILEPQTLDRVRERAHRYIDGREDLFAARIAAGLIRDGHGDLLADDVFCLDDGPRALDCIEFNDRFRWGDVLADVAFLVMDLERLGAVEAAEAFMARYREFSAESHPDTLSDHYVAFRASIRSKVACLKSAQGDEASRGTAQQLLDLCDARLDEARVRLVLVGGPPGTGKSTVGSAIADETGWALLRSDEIRKDLSGLGHIQDAGARFGHGIYDAATTERTYIQMLERARSLLRLGVPAVLDASWSDASHRAAARRLAVETKTDLIELRCDLPAEAAAERIRSRRRIGGDVSDADEAVAAAMAATSDPWPEAVRISTADAPDRARDEALAVVRWG
jgi:aminoglycoside phosphotransferase family enzyme/predicted kinase